MTARAPVDRASLEREVAAERRALRFHATLVAITLFGFLAALLAPRIGLSGAPLIGVYVVTYLAGGTRAAIEAGRALLRGRLDIDLLMVLAALAAAAVGEPRDGAFLLFLFSLAETLEDYALGRTKRAVTSLMDLRPDTAVRIDDRGDGEADYVTVPVEELSLDERVLVRPGAFVPVDGEIVEGESAVDQAAITGESVPVDKGPGDDVFAGTVNGHATLVVRVTKPAEATTLARMIELTTQAQEARAPSERFSDWFGQRYTIAVLVGSALALLIFLMVGLPRDAAFYRAATLLVVASPCAIVISVPAAILAALAAAARRGVLFKGGAALEQFGAIDLVAFDKTGTLTTGLLEVADAIAFEGDEDELLALAAGIEQTSDHPIATCLVDAAREAGVTPVAVRASQAHPGFGVSAQSNGTPVWVGKPGFLEHFGAEFEAEQRSALDALMDAGRTAVVVGRDHHVVGIIGVADRPREHVRAAIDALHARGVTRVAMLTGDHKRVAEAIGRELGFEPDEVHADLLPDQKVARVQELREHGEVAFVGDGINDAAALASADVGVAMGSAGSDAALEAADVALLADDLRVLSFAHDLAARANRIIRQNLIFAVAIMAVMVVLTLAGTLPLPLGVVGHEGGTILGVANGLRLLGGNR